VKRLLGSAFLLFLFATPSFAQDSKPETLNVFIDCDRRSCDFDYIRREIPYVNYVRDRVGSDVHVLITQRGTGSGGREYEMQFMGQEDLSVMVDTLTYSAGVTETNTERREGMTETLARGLVRFLMTTTIGDRIIVSVPVYEESEAPEMVQVINDPWNFWVFNVSLSGEMDGESNQKGYEVQGRMSADRVTEDWKIGLSGRFRYNENEYDLSSGKFTTTNESAWVYGQVVKSLNAHWSAGLTTYSNTSSRNNTKFATSLSPTVEYAVFPYSQSSTRDFRFRYELNFRRYEYDEITVYNETTQVLVQNQLSVTANFRQPWGNARTRISIESFVTDFEQSMFDLYNISMGSELSVRVAKGLSFNVGGEVKWVKDQIWLPLETSEDEEVLVGSKALPTDIEFELQFGFSYRFGSIYNNVVNPRFNMFDY